MTESEEGSSSSSGGSHWVKSVKKKLDELVRMLIPISDKVEELPDDKRGTKLKNDLRELKDELDDTRHKFSHDIDVKDISEDVMMRTNDCLSSMEKCLRGGRKTVAATDLKKFVEKMKNLKQEVEDNYRERLLEQSSFSAEDTDKRASSKSPPSGQFHPEHGTATIGLLPSGEWPGQASIFSSPLAIWLGKSLGRDYFVVRRDNVHDRSNGMSVLILLSLIAVVVAGVVAHKKGYYDSLIKAMSSPLDATDGIPHCGPDVGRSCDEYLLSRLKDLAKQHSSQNEHLWRTFYSAAYDHVRNDSVPKRPVVVMVLNDQPSTQRSVVQQVADTYRSVLEPQKGGGGHGGIVTIEGKELTDVESEAVQRKIKTDIEKGYESGRRAVIVYDFDLLPSCSVLTFHNFCNNEDAPYTDIAILLVVTREGPLAAEDNRNLEEAVMNKFYEKWKDCPSELPQGKIDAILSRVANNVVLLR